MIHDRYHAQRRNPFNEIECSDHYARAMASYGTFITACGFDYDGPKGNIRFAPKLNPEKCKLPFTSATAWGSYEQSSNENLFSASLQVKYGVLLLNTFSFDATVNRTKVSVLINGKLIQSTMHKQENSYIISFNQTIEIKTGQHLEVKLV